MRQALAGMLWSKQCYYFDVDRWLRERDAHPLRTPPARRPRNESLVPHVQRRRRLHARQVGVPLVRGLGPGLPLHPAGHGRPRLREAPDRPDAVAGLPAPDRPDPRLRVELRRREPAGARLGATLFLQQSAARRDLRRGRPRRSWQKRFAQAAAELHLVGEPQGPDRAQRVRGRVPRPGQHRRVRPQRGAARPAAPSSRPTAPPGWRCSARTCSRSPWRCSSTTTTYEDFVLKFVEHFFWIAAAMDPIGEHPDEMWDEEDGFFYDVLRLPDGSGTRLKVRSLVGLLPLCATTVIEADIIERYPQSPRRCAAFLERNSDLLVNIADPLVPGVSTAGGCCPWSTRTSCGASWPACSTRSVSSARTGSARSRAGTWTTRTSSTCTASTTGCSTSRPSRPAECSAATPTGAGRSGSRSTCC